MARGKQNGGQPGEFCAKSLLTGEFQDDLLQFMCTRLDRADPRRESSKYAETDDLAEQLIMLLEPYLPEETRGKLNELVDVQSNKDAMLTEFYYRHGFSDGVMMVVQAMMMG